MSVRASGSIGSGLELVSVISIMDVVAGLGPSRHASLATGTGLPSMTCSDPLTATSKTQSSASQTGFG